MNNIHKQTDELIIWAAKVAEMVGHNVTTTEVLAKVVLEVEKGSSVDDAKKNIMEVYTNESENYSDRMQ